MKIYFDGIIYSWQKGGGVYRYFEELIGRCGENKNTETTLLLNVPHYPLQKKEGVHLKYLFFFKKIPSIFFNLLRKLMSPFNKLLKEMYFKKISAGIFHSTYYTTFKNIKIPQVLTVHDMTHEKFPIYFNSKGAKRFIKIKKTCILNADSIICVSEATKKSLLSIYGEVNSEKIYTVHHGISENFIEDVLKFNNTLLDKPYFLFVGNRGLYKNFTFLVKSFSKWSNNKDFNILLLGGGPLSREEHFLIKKLDLEKQIQPLGFIEEKFLKYIYSKSIALIFPSLDEGFGFPILEALCSRTQVIASDIEAFKEIGKDMPLYFNPQKEEDLIDKLEQSIVNKLDEQELDRRVMYVINNFSWKKCTEQTVEIYKKTHEKYS